MANSCKAENMKPCYIQVTFPRQVGKSRIMEEMLTSNHLTANDSSY